MFRKDVSFHLSETPDSIVYYVIYYISSADPFDLGHTDFLSEF